MASSDDGGYDDEDFEVEEDISEDDGGATNGPAVTGSKTAAKTEAAAAAATDASEVAQASQQSPPELSSSMLSSASQGRRCSPPAGRPPSQGTPVSAGSQDLSFNFTSASRPGSRAGASAGRRLQHSPAERLQDSNGLSVLGGEGQDQVDLGRTVSSSSSANRPRVVRGKVEIQQKESRPGTGESSVASAAQVTAQAPVKDSRPLWLQNDPKPLGRSRPPVDPDSWPEPPRSAAQETSTRKVGRNADRSMMSDRGIDLDDRTSGHGGADDVQRQNKRLQQEIQRLSQRLAETDLYSGQDDGLPVFSLDDVEIGIQIAQGGFSCVHHAHWQCTPCALKKIFDPVLTEELKSEFENEVRMLRRLRHPNVVTLMAVCRKPPALSVLTELVAGGSLYEILHNAPHARPRDAPDCEPGILLPLVRQAAAALAYMHGMLVVHRDIKSQNVLLTEGKRPQAKLCDFGLARMRSELCTGSMQWAGTAPYMAPELFAKKRYDEKVDVFAFGTMTWEVVSTEIPHANLEASDIAHRVQHKDAAGLAMQHSWPKSLKTLLRNMLSVQTETRPPMKEVALRIGDITLEFPYPD
eukprot:TRINITY_DN20733_c0_g1_i1.p1 TRINITY_DN20733_c0_g1~~TRINITY_DN20733_c0_g1_i1.p1  ORF type:complete len:627 (-),score=111.62 TRINITY_DN20733_c0_g1_i1:143-1885(-)